MYWTSTLSLRQNGNLTLLPTELTGRLFKGALSTLVLPWLFRLSERKLATFIKFMKLWEFVSWSFESLDIFRIKALNISKRIEKQICRLWAVDAEDKSEQILKSEIYV